MTMHATGAALRALRTEAARRVGSAGTALTLLAAVAGGAAAQGAGSTGATVLQALAGSRAAALSGAYTGATSDADALFYNPAGIAGLAGAASISYQRYVQDIGIASGAGAVRIGRLTVGASLAFLDYGEIDELVPDPNFGGQTGKPTGSTVSASETAARLSGALELQNGRFAVGAGLGFVSTDLAGASRSAPFFDAGAQYRLESVTVGASIRNLGGALSGSDLADADLPAEARLGAMAAFTRAGGLGAVVSADLVHELNAGLTGLVAGIEAGLLPGGASRIGAVGRIGFDAGTGAEGQGALRLGGGLSLGSLSVDYTWQDYELFGSLHRFGVRWAR
jgi:hypothetical protein